MTFASTKSRLLCVAVPVQILRRNAMLFTLEFMAALDLPPAV
jgi:hypothetical protein